LNPVKQYVGLSQRPAQISLAFTVFTSVGDATTCGVGEPERALRGLSPSVGDFPVEGNPEASLESSVVDGAELFSGIARLLGCIFS
jgi:hypothetical protein